MNIVDTLSVPFYEFRCEESLINEIIPIVENLEYDVDEKATLSKKYFYHEKLINWFDQCLKEFQSIYFDEEIELVIVNCWATKTNFLSNHHTHNHQTALVSGILYLYDSNSGETTFYVNNPWLRYQNNEIMPISYSKTNMLTTKVKQEKGKLILFPPHIQHGTEKNKDRKIRHTIGFDVFFSGRITIHSEKPYVEIKSTSLRDAHYSLENK